MDQFRYGKQGYATEEEKKSLEANEEELRRKWGFKDARANESLEMTHRFLCKRIKNMIDSEHYITPKEILENVSFNPLQKKYLTAQHKHFLNKLDFEAQWKEGRIKHWREFWR